MRDETHIFIEKLKKKSLNFSPLLIYSSESYRRFSNLLPFLWVHFFVVFAEEFVFCHNVLFVCLVLLKDNAYLKYCYMYCLYICLTCNHITILYKPSCKTLIFGGYSMMCVLHAYVQFCRSHHRCLATRKSSTANQTPPYQARGILGAFSGLLDWSSCSKMVMLNS